MFANEGTEPLPHRWAYRGGCAWRGTKDNALVSAGMRPGCGLKYRVAWVPLPSTLYRPHQPFKANPTADPKALFHRRRGNGGAWARVRARTHPLWKKKKSGEKSPAPSPVQSKRKTERACVRGWVGGCMGGCMGAWVWVGGWVWVCVCVCPFLLGYLLARVLFRSLGRSFVRLLVCLFVFCLFVC